MTVSLAATPIICNEGTYRLMTEPQEDSIVSLADRQLLARLLRFSHPAMATRFEVYLLDEDPVDAREASQAVFDRIDQLEQCLSYFIPYSDISRLNRRPPGEPLRVGADTLACLEIARQIHEQTEGAFDVTAGNLLTGRRPWDQDQDIPRGGEMPPEGGGPVPVGMDLIALNCERLEVARRTEHVGIDLGGMGKGYALDLARCILQDWEVATALIHSGQSTMLPLGVPPDKPGWPMRILDPRNERDVLAHFHLQDAAISVSALQQTPTILDPAIGEEPRHWLGAWAIAPTATRADALSTAFMVMTETQIEQYCREHSDTCALVAVVETGKATVKPFGEWQSFDFLPANG